MKVYGLVGKGLSHSFSPEYFQDKFSKLGLEATYELFQLEDINHFPELIRTHKDLKGLNITIPYKEKVIQFLNAITPEAKAISAVNTLSIKEEEGLPFLTGHNTDVIGFKESIFPLIRDRKISKALILGSGGGAKAVDHVLGDFGILSQIVSRQPLKGELSYQLLTKEVISNHLLIINTTPLGMFPNVKTAPDIPYQFIGKDHILFDLVYNPTETLFIKEGRKRGAKVEGGLKMLHRQAEASWEIWKAK
jgi:shikimate dehydrogenase